MAWIRYVLHCFDVSCRSWTVVCLCHCACMSLSVCEYAGVAWGGCGVPTLCAQLRALLPWFVCSLEGIPEGVEQVVTVPLQGGITGLLTLELTFQRC